MKRVVITGTGAVTPIGNTLSEYREGLQAGTSGAKTISHFDATNFKTTFACEVEGVDIEALVGRKESRKLDRFTIFGIIAADEAINKSGLDLEQLDLDRAGVIWGSGIGGLRSLEKEIEIFATGKGIPRYNPFMIPKMIPDIAAGHISIKYGFRGVNYATVSACASASHAMSNAFDCIRLGRNDIVITGGSEAVITKAGIGGFNAMKALSTRNDDYKTASRPFDLDRDGFVLGEGGGALVFEELEHAKRRNANILAEVVGAAATADAYHITAPHPDGISVTKVMNIALQDAGLNAEQIDYINVHGTSTPLGDIAEIKAILKVFGEHAFKVNISSTKSMTGHLLGAAGAVEAIACIEAINHKFIPPTINHFTQDPAIDQRLNLTLNEAQERSTKVAMSNTFGFGGHNSTIIFKAFEN